MAIITACQGVQAYRSEFGWGVLWREVASYPSERSLESGSRKSPDGVFFQLKSGMKFDSHRSSDGVFPQLESGMKSNSRRSPDEVYLQQESSGESDSCRSPGGACR